MTEVCVIERHYNGTRDEDGSVYDRKLMDIGSKEFSQYMWDFGVQEKYEKGNSSRARSYLVKGELQYTTGYAFFAGWVPIYRNNNLRQEMCYIIVERMEMISKT